MKTWQKYTFYALPLVIVAALLYYFSDIVGYIIMAWVISMVGAPLHKFLHKYVSSGLAAGITLLVFSLIFLLMVRLFVPPLITQARNLAGLDYQKIVAGLEEPIGDAKLWLEDKGLIHHELETLPDTNPQQRNELKPTIIRLDSLLRTQGDTLSDTGIDLVININTPEEKNKTLTSQDTSDGLLEGFKTNIIELFNPAKIPQILGSFVGFFGNILVTLLSVFFIAFFFLKENGLFTRMASTLAPNNQESKVNHAIQESSALLIRYFLGLVAQATIITLVTTLILKLLGIQNALLMAFCFAIFNLIPFIGPIIGNLFGVVIVISSNLDIGFYNGMLPLIIKTVIVFGIMQLVDNFLFQPTIFSKSVKAHPLEIFLVVLMGAKIGGVAGMVLAIPAYTVLRVLAKVFFSEFEVVKRLTASM